ncbi:MAG: hypothetical protein IJK87_07165 [Prevotella sp.]|nr:hypothetical protein [Prevotella sp.]
MKKIFLFYVMVLTVCLSSCRSSGNVSGNNAISIGTRVVGENSYKIIVGEERIAPYTINNRKQLKRLSLQEAKDKVLQEAVIARNCATIVEPNYSYDMKGKKIIRITVVGYPGYYDFGKDKMENK